MSSQEEDHVSDTEDIPEPQPRQRVQPKQSPYTTKHTRITQTKPRK